MQMMLSAFEDHDISDQAFNTLFQTLSGGKILNRKLGIRGGSSGEWSVTWHPRAQMWSLLDVGPNRFWFCFGIENPATTEKALDIAVEVNPPRKGTSGHTGGAFAWDAGGMVHLCHNGKIGGGRQGVGKSAFFEHYRGELTQMAHRDRIVEVVDLGPIDSPELVFRIKRFAREVVRIKDLILQPSTSSRGSPQADVDATFTPEFSGARTPFTVRRMIEARADHGLVVDALKKSVDSFGHSAENDRERDLFVRDSRGRLAFLFEVKTDVSTTSIYTAVGQLLLNRGTGMDAIRLILVVPGEPNQRTHDALRSIGIEVLPYEWRGGAPIISELVLGRLMR